MGHAARSPTETTTYACHERFLNNLKARSATDHKNMVTEQREFFGWPGQLLYQLHYDDVFSRDDFHDP